MKLGGQAVVWMGIVCAALVPVALGAAPGGPAPAAPAAPEAAAPAGPGAAEAPPPQGQAPERRTFLQLLESGGMLMYPIYAASILMVAFAIERAVSLRRSRILPTEFTVNIRGLVAQRPLDTQKTLDYCQSHPSPIARIFTAAVRRLHRPLPEVEKAIEDAGVKEVRGLKRNTRVLSAVASVAPLLGLLGTVTGMIKAFQEIAGGEGVGAAAGQGEQLAQGIYEALVTTAAGLTVAIPSLVLYLIFTSRIERLVSEMDDLTMEFVETIAEPERQAA